MLPPLHPTVQQEADGVGTADAQPPSPYHVITLLAVILAFAQILGATLGLVSDPSVLALRAKKVWKSSGADLAIQRICAGAGACAGVYTAVQEVGQQLLGNWSSGKPRMAT